MTLKVNSFYNLNPYEATISLPLNRLILTRTERPRLASATANTKITIRIKLENIIEEKKDIEIIALRIIASMARRE